MKNINNSFKRINYNFFLFPTLLFVLTFTVINPYKIMALEPNWEEVETTKYGKQFLDKSSLFNNSDGTIEISSKYQTFEGKNKKIKNEYIYLMKIDCDNKLFKDIKINNEMQKNNHWQKSNGDLLIDKLIQKSCSINIS